MKNSILKWSREKELINRTQNVNKKDKKDFIEINTNTKENELTQNQENLLNKNISFIKPKKKILIKKTIFMFYSY